MFCAHGRRDRRYIDGLTIEVSPDVSVLGSIPLFIVILQY
jgi:hypothetical protein